MSKVVRVSRKSSRKARHRALKIIHDAQKELRKKGYRFSFQLVGSGKWCLIFKDKNDWYDLDYQLMLTKNCKKYLLDNPIQIRKDFIEAFKANTNDSEEEIDRNTAITVKDKLNKFSFDFVIFAYFPDNKFILRKNNNSSKNGYTWNQYSEFELCEKFKELLWYQKREIIENYVVPAKIKAKLNGDKRKSFQIFLDEINRWGQKNDLW